MNRSKTNIVSKINGRYSINPVILVKIIHVVFMIQIQIYLNKYLRKYSKQLSKNNYINKNRQALHINLCRGCLLSVANSYLNGLVFDLEFYVVQYCK